MIRIDMEVPAQAEFLIESVDDPHDCGAPLAGASMFRRPLPTTNLGFLSPVMWDGRHTIAGHAIRDGAARAGERSDGAPRRGRAPVRPHR